MRRGIGVLFLAGLLLAWACGTASAERTVSVNDNNTGLFDQPSVVMSGSVAHVAFIGQPSGTTGYKVCYAAVNGAADFTNTALLRDNTVILTFPPAVIDNAATPSDAYTDARHPKIALRTATQAVILFQAIPAGDTVYKLFIANLALSGNGVASHTVRRIGKDIAGNPLDNDCEDASFALVASDNTARIVYATRTAVAPTEAFQLAFARVGLDNATAVGSPVSLTALYPFSRGFRPVPRLALDDLNRAHIAWAAADDSGANPGPVYYAMIKETSGADNMVIAPTVVMSWAPARWSHPNVVVLGHSAILILAGDEIGGNLGYVEVNPDAARQDGLPALDAIGTSASFLLLHPPPLDDRFRVWRPEALYDAAGGRILITGYGSGGANPTGGTYFAIKILAASPFAEFVTIPVPFAENELPSTIDGDYTKAAFGFPGGKIVVFWSGSVGAGNRNLDVTSIPTVAAFIVSEEKGCAVAPGRSARGGASARVLMLLVPAIALCARRRSLRVSRRALREGLEG